MFDSWFNESGDIVNMVRTFFTVTALLVIISTGAAQQVQQPHKTVVTMIEAPATSYRKVGKAQILYFDESDTTQVRVDLSPYRNSDQSASMFFVFSVKGKKVVEPKSVKVGMAFRASKPTLQTLDKFSFGLDQEEINMDDLTVGGIGYELNPKSCFRDMEGTMSFASFQKLTKTKVLRVHVNDIVFSFNSSDASALLDMLRTIER